MNRILTFGGRLLGLFFIIALLSVSLVSAADINIINSDDWVDVYSVMLKSELQGRKALFVSSDSTTGFAKLLDTQDTLHLYTSTVTPYIDNLGSQLQATGFDVIEEYAVTNFNQDLDINTGNYILISLDNPRLASAVAPLAIQTESWVLVVDKENAKEVAKKIRRAESVIAVGNFGRDVLKEIQPHFTDWINNKDIFDDSHDIAKRIGVGDTVILTDGSFIETEFFASSNPVLLSGPTRLFSKTFSFLEDQGVQAVVIVGNQLAAVGEQIRTQSNKDISVFIKFGQGDTKNSASVYALSMFPVPMQRIDLTVQQAIYNPASQQLIATFKNNGNIGLYALTTIVVKNGDEELASASLPDVTYVAGGELLPIQFSMTLPLEELNENTYVEFYTSYGVTPTGLDRFLTQDNIHGKPFTLPLTLQTIDDDGTLLYLVDSSYYKDMNRVGVQLSNPSDVDAYVAVKVRDIVINGLTETIYKEDTIPAGQTKLVYLPAKLDRVDLQENDVFDIVVTYGGDADLLLKTLQATQPFKVVSGGRITGLVTGIGGGSLATGWGLVMLFLIGSMYITYFFVRRKNNDK
jgi:hypothetical protein